MDEFFRFLIRFFHGWRRKVGVVTLVIACAFMGLWLRSQSVFDHVYIPLGNRKCDFLDSCEGKMSWGRRDEVESYETPSLPGWTRIPIDVTGEPVNESEDDGLRWHWKWCGFGVYDWVDEPVGAIEIPHWSVVLPLTLLSAYLLLSKLHEPTQKKFTEPISDEGACNMGDFFKGWRRKSGVLTLVLACVFAAGWLRSLHSREFLFIEFEIPFGGRMNVYTSANQMDILLQQSTGWNFVFGKVDPIVTLNVLDGVWFFDVQEIEEEIVDGVLQVAPGYEVRIYFYTIVIPLTLLSAYLLFTKSRPSKRVSPESQAPPPATPDLPYKSPI